MLLPNSAASSCTPYAILVTFLVVLVWLTYTLLDFSCHLILRLNSETFQPFRGVPILPKASRPTEPLLTLMAVANALGPGFERLLGPRRWMLSSAPDRRKTTAAISHVELDARQRRSNELHRWRQLVRKMPKVVRDYIGPITAEKCETAIDRYNEAITAREVLRGFSEMTSPLKGAKLEYLLERRSPRLVRIEFDQTDKRGMKPQFILRFHLSPIVEALDGKDVSRIRICKTCDKVFWAYRYNADYCSRKCGNVFRNREYRKGPEER